MQRTSRYASDNLLGSNILRNDSSSPNDSAIAHRDITNDNRSR